LVKVFQKLIAALSL